MKARRHQSWTHKQRISKEEGEEGVEREESRAWRAKDTVIMLCFT